MEEPRKKFKDREIIKRLRTESPDFFKKVQKLGGFLMTISPLLLLIPFTAPFAGISLTAGTVMLAVGKLPNKGVSIEEAKKLIEESEKLKNEIEKLKTLGK